ncbi:MAG: hypothetical protein KA223_04005 [Candidatus Accumulibacter sp.]|jgi:hypothetical protein|nr:hypothetical protein [Accumulibacter sp.]
MLYQATLGGGALIVDKFGGTGEETPSRVAESGFLPPQKQQQDKPEHPKQRQSRGQHRPAAIEVECSPLGRCSANDGAARPLLLRFILRRATCALPAADEMLNTFETWLADSLRASLPENTTLVAGPMLPPPQSTPHCSTSR